MAPLECLRPPPSEEISKNLDFIALEANNLVHFFSNFSLPCVLVFPWEHRFWRDDGRASAQETDQVKGAEEDDVVVVVHWVAQDDEDVDMYYYRRVRME